MSSDSSSEQGDDNLSADDTRDQIEADDEESSERRVAIAAKKRSAMEDAVEEPLDAEEVNSTDEVSEPATKKTALNSNDARPGSISP